MQEKESDSFKSLFKQGIVYLTKGGHSEEKRMFLVQGRKHHLIAHQVELSSASLNRFERPQHTGMASTLLS